MLLEDLRKEETFSSDEVADSAGIKTDLGRKALTVAIENVKLLDKKQQDYGPHNIGLWGELGCVVRATDKVMRLRTLLRNGREAQNESIIDSYRDLCNYGIIAQMCREGIWPLTMP